MQCVNVFKNAKQHLEKISIFVLVFLLCSQLSTRVLFLSSLKVNVCETFRKCSTEEIRL